MLRHLFKLIWKRKSRNLMLSLEILLAFVIVFAIAAFASRSYQLYRQPVGFHYENVWSVNIESASQGKIEMSVYDNFQRALRAMPEVEQVAFSAFTPYEMSSWTTDYTLAGGRTLESNMMPTSDDFLATLDIPLVEGRAYSRADDGDPATPVVVNRRLAASLAPGKSALGVQFYDGGEKSAKRKSFRVVGVIDDFRNRGEFMEPVNFALVRFAPNTDSITASTILLKLKPGTPRSFETKLSAQLKAVHGDWAYVISPMRDKRSNLLREQMMPLIVISVISAFVLVMVAFGLFGVLWQNTTQRIPEIGLRRAIGASAGNVYRQIIGEQMLLSSLAMAIALLLLVQLPLTGVLAKQLSWSVFLSATAISMALIYLISLLCALYPGWRASRLSPAEALHYE